MAKIAVIGGGINGILTAKILQDNSHDVTVIEENKECGQRTTFANGCQLSFSHTTPVFIRPSFYSRSFARPFILSNESKKWLKLHRSSQKENEAKFRNITEIAIKSSIEFEKILTKYHSQAQGIHHHFGTAYIFANKKQFEYRKKLFEVQKTQYNLPYKVLMGNEIPDCDLALANLCPQFKYGIFAPQDQTLNALKFTQILEKEFIIQGGKVCYNNKILKIQHNENGVQQINTTSTTFTGYDFYVYAGGASGLELIKGLCPNLQKIAGYSLTFDVSYSNHCPFVNVIDLVNKVVYSRHGDLLRVAGLFDIQKFATPEKRIDDLHRIAIKTLPILTRQNLVHQWCEERVFTPNELPICQKVLPNFVVNTAHGHLGVTLSAWAGNHVANIINKQ